MPWLPYLQKEVLWNQVILVLLYKVTVPTIYLHTISFPPVYWESGWHEYIFHLHLLTQANTETSVLDSAFSRILMVTFLAVIPLQSPCSKLLPRDYCLQGWGWAGTVCNCAADGVPGWRAIALSDTRWCLQGSLQVWCHWVSGGGGWRCLQIDGNSKHATWSRYTSIPTRGMGDPSQFCWRAIHISFRSEFNLLTVHKTIKGYFELAEEGSLKMELIIHRLYFAFSAEAITL